MKARRGTEAVWFDTFADWSTTDQAAAMKTCEQIHRQKVRGERKEPKPAEKPAEAKTAGNGSGSLLDGMEPAK